MSTFPAARPAPSINLPKCSSICDVSIIDTSCNIVSASPTLLGPPITGHDWLNLPTYSFLIQHQSTGDRVLFDLGSRVDWQNLVPHVAKIILERIPGMRTDKEVVDILSENGINLSSIKALILSHWHYDHAGNFQRLHPGTDVLVGPGFRDAHLPGYPTKEMSGFHETDFCNVNIIEVPFGGSNRTLKIGEFQAYDYFGDGSLYILNVPGHTVGHISALVRTSPETALFLGGDVCHFPGMIRPNEYSPMPDPLPAATLLDERLPSPCPCAIFTACHPDPGNARTKPFYECAKGSDSWYEDPATAQLSLSALAVFDADPAVMILLAHDPALREAGLPFFPHGTLNDWQARGWKDSTWWHFVNELPVEGRAERPPLVDGMYVNGVRVRDLYGNEVK